MEISRIGWLVAALVGPLVACGQGRGQGHTPAAASSTTGESVADESCLGFTLLGSKYSPGGSVLPHTCKPFDAVTNNPYAVRCIDALPNFKTQFPGDEYCILPPPPDQGIQLGVHPQGAAYWDKMYAGDYSDYANAALTKPFEVPANSEVVQNFDVTAPNPQTQNYFRITSRMREGSHHLASWFNQTPMADGWEPLSSNEEAGLGTNPTFFNVQSTHSDRPSSVELAPEDQGLGLAFKAKASIGFQLHHINVGSTPILREAWVNLWWLPAGEAVTPVTAEPITLSINYPPNKIIDNTSTVVATADTRLVSVFGHRHAWTTRFSAQIVRASGATEELYDSFSWLEMPTFELDSVTTNPTANVADQRDGALSGLTILHQGDKVQFDCHVETTAARASKLGVAVPTSNLHFTNEAFAGEMCILYLETAGPELMTQ